MKQMCPPACHPNPEEEREVRALAIETINEALQRGQSQTRFHRFRILAWRLSHHRDICSASETETVSIPVEVWIKCGGELMVHDQIRVAGTSAGIRPRFVQ